MLRILLLSLLCACAAAAFARPVPPIARLNALPADTTSVYLDVATDESLLALKRFKQLEHLTIVATQLGEDGFKPLAEIAGLKTLEFSAWSNFTGASLRWLAGMTALEELVCEHWLSCTAEELQPLAGLTKLRVLKLTLYEGKAEGLKLLAGLPALETLALPHAELQDDDLAALAGFPRLKNLDLSECESLTDAALAHVGKLKALEELSLDAWVWVPTSFTSVNWNQWTGAGLKHLVGLQKLRFLNLQGSPELRDEDCELIAKLSGLESLVLGYCELLTDEGLRALAPLKQLRELYLDSMGPGFKGHGFDAFGPECLIEVVWANAYTGLDDSGLAVICRLKQLRVLHIEGCTDITVDGYRHLASAANLRELTLGNKEVTPDEFRAICAVTGLEVLELWQAGKLTNQSLDRLPALKQLRVLYLLDAEGLTDGAFERLGELAGLRTLAVTGSQVTNSGLLSLEKLTGLEKLDISGSFTLGRTLSGLRALVSLRELDLSGCRQLSNESINHVRALGSLEHLRMHVNDELTDESVLALAAMPQMQLLSLGTLPLKREPLVEALRKAAPTLELSYWLAE